MRPVYSILIIIFCGVVFGEQILSSNSNDTPSFTRQTYPKVDGSTVTIPLSVAVAARLTGLPKDTVSRFVIHNKTHQAYLNLVNRRTDLIFVTSPSAEELDSARAKGITLEVVPIVSEGFVFLTGRDNTVDNLTLQQIVDIYSGKITNWSQVGGYDTIIRAYQRPVNSGSQTGFLDLVMKDVTPVTPPPSLVVAQMDELIDMVSLYTTVPNAIGYTYYYFIKSMYVNPRTKLLKINGVLPDTSTIRNISYPITTAYYAVYRNDEPETSNVRKVVKWILAEQGQNLCDSLGYVKVGKSNKAESSYKLKQTALTCKISPNPVSGLVNISWPKNSENGILTISRLDGKVIFTKNIAENLTTASWNSAGYPHGLYLVNIKFSRTAYSVRILLVR
ncbi:MAG: substrate-binding domain-containing protein [Fibrobacteres bacterium]|nr:substrate-binding domain-containing protein [Fibrobacterota bacterium]